MFYKPKHFTAKELVPRSFYEKWGELSLQWMDAGLLHDLDIIREELGVPLLVNGGNYNWSGLRDSGFSGYSPTSAHTLGKAVDFKLIAWLKGDYSISFDFVTNTIKRLKQEGKLKYITRLEVDTYTWVHVDTLNREPNDPCGLFIFRP